MVGAAAVGSAGLLSSTAIATCRKAAISAVGTQRKAATRRRQGGERKSAALSRPASSPAVAPREPGRSAASAPAELAHIRPVSAVPISHSGDQWCFRPPPAAAAAAGLMPVLGRPLFGPALPRNPKLATPAHATPAPCTPMHTPRLVCRSAALGGAHRCWAGRCSGGIGAMWRRRRRAGPSPPSQ